MVAKATAAAAAATKSAYEKTTSSHWRRQVNDNLVVISATIKFSVGVFDQFIIKTSDLCRNFD
jgi:hypothetical protein